MRSNPGASFASAAGSSPLEFLRACSLSHSRGRSRLFHHRSWNNWLDFWSVVVLRFCACASGFLKRGTRAESSGPRSVSGRRSFSGLAANADCSLRYRQDLFLRYALFILKMNNLSTEEIATQASNLYDHWQTMEPGEKRGIIEAITDKIIIGKDEITINLCYTPSCKEVANKWRKGWDLNPR